MSEMVERVARAMAHESDKRWIGYDQTEWWEHLNEFARERWRAYARAALAAMRSPTLAMRKVCSFETAEVEYPAMIDAALSQE